MKWTCVLLVGVFALATGPVFADEPLRPAQVWLVPEWEDEGTVDSYVSVLNVSGVEARVTCHAYTETGVRDERASQTKTYAAGASRSNEGGSIPCGFPFASARRGWAVVSSPTPIIVRAERCQGLGNCAPIEARPIDCRTPAGLEAACRHAPAVMLELSPEIRERLIAPGARPRG